MYCDQCELGPMAMGMGVIVCTPELPAPITMSRLPSIILGDLYSWECMRVPEKLPASSGHAAFQWWPFATTTDVYSLEAVCPVALSWKRSTESVSSCTEFSGVQRAFWGLLLQAVR